ncbi:DUF3857 domain-containing transglutaminase family protein [Flavobacterium sp. 123]|uniref:DUF3857 domain-containing transglutaminase family protein n=1 Tax=Flavobacterium sp. 123 TaxID=2135627 RepID=UPI000EB33779|nr:DUF3857 domain-containing transglutaminase family protein [Flavobacterium sp. 123]RKS99841.1 transglutaminase superfamily protein [Flavobacterium sp. 123]
MGFKYGYLIILLFTTFVFSQKLEYSTLSIPDSLKQNANSVVRLNQIDIGIVSQRNMTVKTKRVVTVLNEKGLGAIDAAESYDKRTTIKAIEATVFDSDGKEIKKIKRKDFKDQSAADGATIFSDNRYLYLDYTPIQYPFTIVYDSEIETSTTAFIPQWFPVTDYFVTVEKSVLNVNYPDNLGFRKMEFNFSNFKIKKTTDTATQLSYIATNILAQKNEDYSPAFSTIFPKVMMGLELFHLEGVDGKAKTWKEFGQWWFDEILAGTEVIPEETKAKMKLLVGEEKDPIKKAKLIYDYVQKKVRYVSIQEGIGGWKPMPAADVDRLGYGDCKALTNYTKALLTAVDVPSYYTKLYGSNYKTDIISDFVSQQGNHIILAIPIGNGYTWLECTSQDDPFGYQGTFTDDRTVLVVKPSGGEIVRTNVYHDEGNTQQDWGTYTLSTNGDLSGKITIVSQGSQYSRKAPIQNWNPIEKESHYKAYWDNINNLKLGKIIFSDDKENIKLAENIEINAVNYGIISNGKMMFAVNVFNQYTGSIKRIRNRKNPFEIQRGYVDTDEINIVLPHGFSIEFLPANFELNSKYGAYKTEIIKKDASNLIYKRTLFVKKGLYSNKEYDEYRLFMEQISKNDNAKIILTLN